MKAGPGKQQPAAGFSLIEMLVVISIIAILVSLLIPVMGQAREKAWLLKCKSNLKNMGVAYVEYANDHEDRLVGASTRGWSRNKEATWTWDGESWHWIVERGGLYPYVGQLEVYKCPRHLYPAYLRSYSINGNLNAEGSAALTKLSMVAQPDKIFSFVEDDDPRGTNMGSWIIADVNNWIDRVPGNHLQGDNVTFVDGHVEFWKYVDPDRTLDRTGFYASQPGNKDLARYWKHYRPSNLKIQL